MGDTNARLGSILSDRNINGKLTINANQPLLREFLEYSDVTILNTKYCRGVPTHEIAGREQSLSDLCFTNSPDSQC